MAARLVEGRIFGVVGRGPGPFAGVVGGRVWGLACMRLGGGNVCRSDYSISNDEAWNWSSRMLRQASTRALAVRKSTGIFLQTS